MGILGKGLTTSLSLRIKNPNKKQKLSFAITDIINQYFRKLLKGFNNSSYLGYKNKQVPNKPTESYFLLIIHVSKIIKINNNIRLLTKGVKLDSNKTKRINKTIGHFNKTIQSGIT